MKLFVRIGFFIKIVFPLHEFRLRGIALKKKKKTVNLEIVFTKHDSGF